MAAIGPQRIRVSADQSVFRVAALNAAVKSLGPYFPTVGQPQSDFYVPCVEVRFKEFLALLEEGSDPQTFGGDDAPN